MDLSKLYTSDLNEFEFLSETISTKKFFPSLNESFHKMDHFEILQLIHGFDLKSNYTTNLEII